MWNIPLHGKDLIYPMSNIYSSIIFINTNIIINMKFRKKIIQTSIYSSSLYDNTQ